jgi:small-conductance mechanosensitive channel
LENNLTEFLQSVEKVLNYTLFSIKQTPVSLASIILFILLLFAFVVLARVIGNVILKRFFARLQVEEGISYSLIRITQYIIMITGVIVSLQFVGVDLSGLVVIFGLLSVGIGFGLQNITSNFVSGLVLLIERPIRVGDRVTVGDTLGDVVEINMRSTTIRTLTNIAIIIPNSEFTSSQVINWSHGDPRVRLDLSIGVSYNSDLETVLRSLREVAEENNEVLKDPGPEINFTGFGDSSWDLELRAWLESPKNYQKVRSDLNCAIVNKFRNNKVEIPFPQRDLHLRSSIPFPVPKQENRTSN